VSCLCPGPVSTKEEIIKDTISKLGWVGKLMMLDARQVGEEAVRRTLNGRLLIVPGFFAKLISIVLRLLPRRMIVFMYYKLSK
jgi:short-subunit dehydrogenase